jgi:twitching motility protein PilT
VFRRIPPEVPTIRELELPESVEAFAHRRGGLVLVTGATGSGKSSTLAALVDVINEQYRRHVITLEDPIEFLHPPKQSIVHQRGLHYDLTDFPSGIRAALREDPEVLLIGEMRDLETMRLALTAAEVGALVFGTLATSGAVETVDRIVEVFPSDEQPMVRSVLSHALAGVVSQVLLRRVDRPGRVVATEVLVGTPAVANLIREGKTQDLTTVIQTGRATGMHTLDDSLEGLVARGIVEAEEACYYASNKARFQGRGAAAAEEKRERSSSLHHPARR